MNVFCQSVDFRSCSAAAAEKLVLDRQQKEDFLHSCRGRCEISDALVLNTCNRLEFYFYAKRQFNASAFISNFIFCDCWNEYKQTFYGLEVARHLFNVAAGLESQIIGENEIFSQLKSAYSFALRCGTVKFMFHHLLHSAFRAAKAVKTHTNISAGALSIAQAAVELAANNIPIQGAKIFVIGSGSNAELIVKHLIRKKVRDFTIVARNLITAGRIIEKTIGLVLPLSELENNLLDVDVVFIAAASQGPLIKAAGLESRIKPLILVDLSMPPGVEPPVKEMDNVKLFDIDSLSEIINFNNLKRRTEIPRAQAIIDEHLRAFKIWQSDLNLVPQIAQKFGR